MYISEKDVSDVIHEINSNYPTPRIILDCTYEGYKVIYSKERRDVFNTGFVPRKILYTCLTSFLLGVREGKQLQERLLLEGKTL